MKTTVDISDELLLQAKELALKNRCTLRQIIEQSLRRELQRSHQSPQNQQRRIRWVTVPGEPASGLDISNREAMYDWLSRHR